MLPGSSLARLGRLRPVAGGQPRKQRLYCLDPAAQACGLLAGSGERQAGGVGVGVRPVHQDQRGPDCCYRTSA